MSVTQVYKNVNLSLNHSQHTALVVALMDRVEDLKKWRQAAALLPAEEQRETMIECWDARIAEASALLDQVCQ